MTVKCDKKLSAIIFSFSLLKDVADDVQYCQELDHFEVQCGNYCFVFERYNNVYVCDFSTKKVESYIFVVTVCSVQALYTVW